MPPRGLPRHPPRVLPRGWPAMSGAAGGGEGVRLWAISDIHTDMPENMAWLRGLDGSETSKDALILAGDVSHRAAVLRETLRLCKERFARVFFCAGNHDLWHDEAARPSRPSIDAVEKLRRIVDVCDELGVECAPAEFGDSSGSALVVPLQSWHHPQWDTEPDIDTHWDGVAPVEQIMMDYACTSWPRGVQIGDGTAAQAVDGVNDELFDMDELLERRARCEAVVSFSHMLPRQDLLPEKRYLFTPALAKASGSVPLRRRVERLRPDVHVFGHTHFGYDLDLDGVRYVQAPLSYPAERRRRGSTVAVGPFLGGRPQPFLLWGSAASWAPRSGGAWSEYAKRYGRRPEVTWILPAYSADLYRPKTAAACVGWLEGRMPSWLFGPRGLRVEEARAVAEQIGTAMASGKPRPGRDEPKWIEPAELQRLREREACVVVDVRADADAAAGRLPGSVALPHPTGTEGFPRRGQDCTAMDLFLPELRAERRKVHACAAFSSSVPGAARCRAPGARRAAHERAPGGGGPLRPRRARRPARGRAAGRLPAGAVQRHAGAPGRGGGVGGPRRGGGAARLSRRGLAQGRAHSE
ncbi:unnamed protein product, partial [Prorocentrum cordatum]